MGFSALVVADVILLGEDPSVLPTARTSPAASCTPCVPARVGLSKSPVARTNGSASGSMTSSSAKPGEDEESDAAKLARRVQRFGRIAPMTEQEAADKLAKRRAKFGLTGQVMPAMDES